MIRFVLLSEKTCEKIFRAQIENKSKEKTRAKWSFQQDVLTTNCSSFAYPPSSLLRNRRLFFFSQPCQPLPFLGPHPFGEKGEMEKREREDI